MAIPRQNSPTTLSIDYFALCRAIGLYAGLPSAREEWDFETREKIDDIINEGYRNACFPIIADDSDVPHDWHFLAPIYTFSTQGGVNEYVLPSEFVSPLDNISHQDGDHYATIPWTSPSRVQALVGRDDSQSAPVWAAIKPLEAVSVDSPRYAVMFYPIPDTTYTLSFTMQVSPKMPSDSQPQILGDQAFGQLVLLSCLAVAERVYQGKIGPNDERYRRQLRTAIKRDHKRGAATLGYVGDAGIPIVPGRSTLRSMGLINYDSVLYNNVDYTD